MSKTKKQLKAPKVKTPSVKINLTDKELQALKYLRNFPDFQGKSNAAIFRTTLMIVAVDAANKMKEMLDQQAQAQQEEKKDV